MLRKKRAKSYLDQFVPAEDRREERREELREKLKRIFSPRNFSLGFRSVISGFREYAAFFAAVFIVQLLFWSVVINADSKAATMKKEALDSCSFDVAYFGLTGNEWTAIYNSQFMIADYLTESERGYVSYEAEEYEDAYGNVRYEVRFLLPAPGQIEAFSAKYDFHGENVRIRYSERVTCLEEIHSLRSREWLTVIGVGLLGIAVILILFLIRTNHYKFRYGIYMSFGADFERLFLTAAYELLAVSLLMFLPGLGTVLGVTALRLAGTGGTLGFSPANIWAALLWNLAVILCAVTPSVKVLTSRTPLSLIVAADNSNLVSSPKRSFRIFRKKFPFHYELFGFWRFRRYYAGLLASAVLFTTVFLTGIFLSDMVTTAEQYRKPQFSLQMDGEVMDDVDAGEIMDLDGVDCVLWESSTEATLVKTFAVLTRKQAAGISSMTVDARQKGMKADNNFKYMALVPELAEYAVNSGLWTVEGDLGSVFDSPDTVAVTERISNKKMLNFKVGDKILIATPSSMIRNLQLLKPDKKYALKQLLNNYEFDYREVTVGAVIDSTDTDNSYSIMMPSGLYSEITGHTPTVTSMEVYLSDAADHQRAEELFSELRGLVSFYSGGDVTDLREDYRQSTAREIPFRLPILLCSGLMLVISAIVWLLSQSNFSSKREKENFMLSAFGAMDSQLKKLYLVSGAFLAALASTATAAFSSLLNYLIYTFINNFLISMKFISGVRYEYSLSWWGLLLCVAVSAVCALASTYLPLGRYLKSRGKAMS